MRRSVPVLLSAVLTVLAVVGLHPTAASARPAAAEPGKVVNTWFTGTMAPGETKTARSWLNVLPDQTYGVSLSPVGATTSESCSFRVDRVWYEQRPEGNKDFRYTIRNLGFVACAATVMVYRIPAMKVRSTGGLDPGEVKRFEETFLDDSRIYQVGLLPSGATSSHRCKLEVVRLWYTHRFQGDVATVFEVTYEVKNVGDIACQGDVLLGSAPIERSSSIGGIEPLGWSGLGLDASPETAYVPGVRPNLGCTMEVHGTDHVQRISPGDGSVEREVFISARNRNSTYCDGKFTLASMPRGER